MTLEQVYEVSGGNMDDILQRIPSRALLIKLVRMFVDDPSKAKLDEAIGNNDPVEAFKAVHTMKGVTLSLGLDLLSEPCKALTEDLRPGQFPDGWKENYEKVCQAYDAIIKAAKEIED